MLLALASDQSGELKKKKKLNKSKKEKRYNRIQKV